MFGKTKAIDMAYTRRNEIVHAHVRVTDISFIPYYKTIMYKDEGYRLSVAVEVGEGLVDMAPVERDGHNDDQGDDR